jgi:CubicO group peptidase (beta-lactamase class C family)
VVVVKDGEVFFSKGYGFTDLESKKPVDPAKTLFRPGSISKLFTWTSIMQLVEQGKLSLDADVNTYLDFTIPATFPQPITLKNLMTHTPGFEDKQNGIMKNNPDEWIVISRLPNNRPWFRARILPRALRTIPEPIISRAIIFQRRKKSCYC